MSRFHPTLPRFIPITLLSLMWAPGLLGEDSSGLEAFTGPYRDIRVGSPDTSTIIGIHVDEGERVQHGQILVQLDDSVLRAAVEVAREAASATGELEAAQQTWQARERLLSQTRDLHKRQHATAQELQTAETERNEAAARVKAHRELIARRRHELHRTEAELERLTIRSPLDGLVVEIFHDVGEVVSPADPHLLRLVQLDPLKVIATGSIEQIESLRSGQKLPMEVAGAKHVATIEYISPLVDAQSGRRVIHLRVANPTGQIPSGVPCQVFMSDSPDERSSSPPQRWRQTWQSPADPALLRK